ncbi:MAG: hypothetical protein Q9217_000008 [Psora testacea]
MSSFKVPLSSSPPIPSTPDISAKRATTSGSPNFLASNPSTTPPGPPPSSVGSFTPPGPPPSSILGSSQLGSSRTLFKSRNTSRATPRSRRSETPSSKSEKLAKQLAHSSRFEISSINGDSARSAFGLSNSSPTRGNTRANGLCEENEEDMENEPTDEGQHLMEGVGNLLLSSVLDSSYGTGNLGTVSHSAAKTSTPGAHNSASFLGSSSLALSPRGVKRSRGGAAIPHDSPRSVKKPPRLKKDSAMPSIAKAMATQMGTAPLTEPDEMILKTEDLVATLYAAESNDGTRHRRLRAVLPKISEDICNLWVSWRDRDVASSPPRSDAIGIGPGKEEPSLHKAIFASTLLLQLHHPPTASGKQALALSCLGNSLTSSRPPIGDELPLNPTAIPKVLMDWLDKHHNPWESTFHEVETKYASPPAHYNFWDVIFVLVLRGKIRDVVRILKKSDFRFAETARKDGQNDGYTDLQVRNIQRVVNKSIQVLESCPALKDEDWHVTGGDWAIFRKRIEQAVNDLALFAEGRDRASDPVDSAIVASDFGMQSSSLSHSQIARRAESRVPWSVYQSLKAMYGILLGGNAEIISSAQDWVEASMGLTIWWAGEDVEVVSVGSLAVTKRSLRQSHSPGQRMVDIDSQAAYLDRLSYCFERATDDSNEDDFQIDSNNPVEVGLASVFEGNVEGVMSLLHGWSLPVADAVAEIATLGGWFSSSSIAPNGLAKGFDESDLIVLSSYGHLDQPMWRDTIMIDYAEAIFNRCQLYEGVEVAREGWEISISLLVRLGDDNVSRREVGKILSRLPIDSDARIDMILRICGDYGMEKEAHAITERYADTVAETSNNYGTALIYYARAHSSRKVKDMLDLLISLSLVQSIAFPPLSSVDANLHSLISSPKRTLAQLAILDGEAAAMLFTNLTGYATLREFYHLRDEEVNLKEGQRPALKPKARKRAASTALLAVISSAADNISGGLYDESRRAVIRVDGLLALLGEAMMLVNQQTSLLTLPECFSLLTAIEDLETVTERVYNKCEECFQSTLSAYHDNASPASPRQLLKTMSSMTSASSFSLVGSSMVDSQTSNGSGALIQSPRQQRRGWDWREGTARDTKGEDVLRILRLGLARDIARHWVEDDDV